MNLVTEINYFELCDYRSSEETNLKIMEFKKYSRYENELKIDTNNIRKCKKY